MVLVFLARHDTTRLREAVVHPHLAGAGDVRHTPSNDVAALGVGVEAPIDEVADAAAGLRAAPGIGLLDRAAVQRSGLAALVSFVLQEADEVAHRDMAEAQHQRIAGRCRRARRSSRSSKPSVDEDVVSEAMIACSHAAARRRCGAARRCRQTRQRHVGRDPSRGAVGVAPPRQHARRGCRARRSGYRARRDLAGLSGSSSTPGSYGDELDAIRPVIGRRRRVATGSVEQHAAIAGIEVALPGEPADV